MMPGCCTATGGVTDTPGVRGPGKSSLRLVCGTKPGTFIWFSHHARCNNGLRAKGLLKNGFIWNGTRTGVTTVWFIHGLLSAGFSHDGTSITGRKIVEAGMPGSVLIDGIATIGFRTPLVC